MKTPGRKKVGLILAAQKQKQKLTRNLELLDVTPRHRRGVGEKGAWEPELKRISDLPSRDVNINSWYQVAATSKKVPKIQNTLIRKRDLFQQKTQHGFKPGDHRP